VAAKKKRNMSHMFLVFFGCHIAAYKYAAKPFPRKKVLTSYILSIKLTIIETN